MLHPKLLTTYAAINDESDESQLNFILMSVGHTMYSSRGVFMFIKKLSTY